MSKSHLTAFVLLLNVSLPCLASEFEKTRMLPKEDEQGRWVEGRLCLDERARELQFIDMQNVRELAIHQRAVRSMVYEYVTAEPHFRPSLIVLWPKLFFRSKQHFLTVRYDDASGNARAKFRLNKDNYQKALDATSSLIGRIDGYTH